MKIFVVSYGRATRLSSDAALTGQHVCTDLDDARSNLLHFLGGRDAFGGANVLVVRVREDGASARIAAECTVLSLEKLVGEVVLPVVVAPRNDVAFCVVATPPKIIPHQLRGMSFRRLPVSPLVPRQSFHLCVAAVDMMFTIPVAWAHCASVRRDDCVLTERSCIGSGSAHLMYAGHLLAELAFVLGLQKKYGA